MVAENLAAAWVCEFVYGLEWNHSGQRSYHRLATVFCFSATRQSVAQANKTLLFNKTFRNKTDLAWTTIRSFSHADGSLALVWCQLSPEQRIGLLFVPDAYSRKKFFYLCVSKHERPSWGQSFNGLFSDVIENLFILYAQGLSRWRRRRKYPFCQLAQLPHTGEKRILRAFHTPVIMNLSKAHNICWEMFTPGMHKGNKCHRNAKYHLYQIYFRQSITDATRNRLATHQAHHDGWHRRSQPNAQTEAHLHCCVKDHKFGCFQNCFYSSG